MTQSAKEKFDEKFESLHWTEKARAIGALERSNEEYERQKPIREAVEKYGDRVIEITEFANYHFIKYRRQGETKEMYQVYIDGKRCIRVTENPKIILLVALAYEMDGINTQADRLVAQMLGIKEEA